MSRRDGSQGGNPAGKRGGKGITIVKREEVVEAGHHGGAWKVAYADFVTAMMAFFLLMWLLNATTDAQKRGLADYFAPTLERKTGASGSGQPFAGQSPFDDGPAISDRGTIAVMNANAPPVDQEDDGSDTLAVKSVHAEGRAGQGAENAGTAAKPAPPATPTTDGPARRAEAAAAAARAQEQAQFAAAAARMQAAIAADPALATFARQLSIDVTPEGLRLQLHDEDGRPMFDEGSATPAPHTRALLLRLAPMLQSLHEKIAIAGYTDAAPYAGEGHSNWDLSSERALATRRILTEAGLPDARIRDVTGHADRDLLRPETPLAAENRRVAILLVRSASLPPDPPPLPAR